jgi:uncharacterized membrane protein (TIGR01666 family)
MDYIKQYKSFINSYNLSGAVRITFGIIFPTLVLSYFSNLSTGIVVSIGAMCVGNTDNPGPIHHRRNGFIACTLIIFAVTLLTGLVSGSPWLTGTMVFLFCFLFSMMGVYGSRASSIGLNALLVMVLNIDRSHHGLDILWNALYVLAGGVWYTVLSLLLYSFRPFRLTQQALGDCVQATAGYLRIKAAFYEREADYDKNYRQLLGEQVDVHEKQELVRELLFKSRDIVKETTHTGRVLVMIFLDIVDLFERVMTSHQDYPALHKAFDATPILEEYRQLILVMSADLDNIGIALKSGKPSVETPALAARIKEVVGTLGRFRDEHRTAGNVESFIGLRQILESIQDIADRLHTLHGYTTYDDTLGKAPGSPVDYELFVTHQDITQKLFIGNLSLGSNIFRHSLRMAIATLAGYLISRLLAFGHGYWILLTIIVILKPAYSLTKKRNYERLMGTLAGALTGLLIIYFIRDSTVLFVLMTLFMIGTYAFLRTNYLICVSLLTPYVLLLFHLLYPSSFRSILSDRVIDTAIGSGIAFLANLFLVPSWEHEQILNNMVRIIGDNLRYFVDVAGAFSGKAATVTQYKLSRKRAYVSLANLSDAFNRMLSEPRSKQKNVQAMHQFVVSNHMLTSHIATLAYYVPSPAAGKPSPGAAELPTVAGSVSADYLPVVESISGKLEHAETILRAGKTVNRPVAVTQGLSMTGDRELSGAGGKEGLRTLNGKVAELMQRRKAELEQGITDSHTRSELSGLKPIVDQFNFIGKVAADLEKLSESLIKVNSQNPAFPAAS